MVHLQFEFTFHTKKRRAEYDTLTIIRVGTSGGLQPDTELGTSIITAYVVGLDNTGLFYDAPYHEETLKMLEDATRQSIDGAIPDYLRFKGKIFPYASKAHEDVVDALEQEARRLGVKYKKGITVSNSGFFANQGRSISRVPLTIPGIDALLASMDTGIEGLKIENMEMEASFLLYFTGALRYRAGVICPIIDKRGDNKFTSRYAPNIKDATKVALGALNRLK